ncbi:choice-of-anchor L domain-containing protein [Roseibacillus ishigakijimensis]|uniref:Choice-of-anchor L domain-containing protein n=2 Tax=Roseibacillus ishigakijimensis TaxID=454146 RepID=A0A934RRG3_9BACT|nr:choice-of-anchor L domain-containing protein [Roseibacillus ishigakijimensis]
MAPEVEGDCNNPSLSWKTAENFHYYLDSSPDLEDWTWTGREVAGTGSRVVESKATNAKRMFFRVREMAEPNNDAFTLLPLPADESDEIDGICFAFDLNLLPKRPSAIQLFKRATHPPNQPWEELGKIRDFDEEDDFQFIRGCAVWLAEVAPGDDNGVFELQASALNEEGVAFASSIRQVTLGRNMPPTVTITAGPEQNSPNRQFVNFTALTQDVEGDPVRRVEFYANGELIGTDSTPTETDDPAVLSFGNNVLTRRGNYVELLRLDDDPSTPEDESIHHITAKAYDSRGAVGETAESYPITVTSGNARPQLEVLSPTSDFITVVEPNNTFTIHCLASDPDGDDDLASIEATILSSRSVLYARTPPEGSFTFDTSDWDLKTHVIEVVARDQNGDTSLPYYLEVDVSSGLAHSLVSSIVAGSSVTVVPGSERFHGVEASSGLFSGGLDAGLEMDAGALLTTGRKSNWNSGDEDEGSHNDTEWRTGGNAELEDRVVGFRTEDAAVLEFDIIPSSSQIDIEYQFASEEYVEWVTQRTDPSCHNDAFMITVNGVLVSMVPDCSDIVAVHSIHPSISAEESDCNPDDVSAENEHLYVDDSDILARVDPEKADTRCEYDGMTIKLRSHVFVTPNQTYRMKFIIADVDDAQYDSALFIKENSLRSPEESEEGK